MTCRRFLAGLIAVAGCGGGEPSAPPPVVAAPSLDAAVPPKPAAPPGPVVWDLIANRPLASLHLDGDLIIDGGSADFWKYIDGGWKSNWYPGERDPEGGGRPVALVQGIAGVVRFPMDPDAPDGDFRIAFTLRPAVARQSLSLFLDEKPLANLALVDGYKTYEVTLPRARLGAGDHSVRFHFRGAGTISGRHTAAAIERILVGPRRPSSAGGAAGTAPATSTDPAVASGPLTRLGAPYAIGGDSRRALSASRPARFSYYLQVPADTRLAFSFGVDPAPAGDASPRFAVRAAVDGDPAAKTPRVEPTLELWTGRAGAGWQSATVDLAPLAGKTARIDLAFEGGGGAFAQPVIVSAPVEKHAHPKPKVAEHVLVWMVDTLRADRLSAWSPATVTKTPGFDQLAREGTRFARTTVQGNYSLPSHSSLLTGVLPSVHKMYQETDRLPAELPLISQGFQRAGFATAIFSSNGYVSDKWGFKKGWDHYRNFIREEQPNGAESVWKAAKPWLTEQAKLGKRTFMYLATVDPHVAYNPPERFLKPYWQKPYHGAIVPARTSEQLYQFKIGKLKLGDDDRRYLEALYDAEVAQNDATFQQVVTDLKTLGLYDKTAIVIISDHGDEFFDHGSVGHGHSLYQELIDVPLIIRWPSLYPEAATVLDGADLTDVYASLFELAGLDPNSEAQGEPLSRFAEDAAHPAPRIERPAEAFHDQVLRSLRLGRWKLITWSGARVLLFDLDTDPHEKHDLAASRPLTLRWMRNVFAIQHAFETRWHKRQWGVASDEKSGFAEDIGM